MDLLDLPSLSDEDELDYEGETTEIVPSGSTGNNAKSAASSVDKVGNAEGAAEAAKEAGESSTATKDNENVPISTFSLLKQHSRKRKLQNSGGPSSDEDEEEAYESFESVDDDNDRRQEVNIEMPGRLAGRVKRIVNKTDGKQQAGGSISDDGDDEEEGLEENSAAELFAQILDGKSENHRNLNDDELEELYASLEADPDDQHLRFNTIYVTGALDNMTIYDISRIFAQFNPENVRPMDNNNTAFIVTFANPLIAAEMLLEMSKPLRRIRKPKKPEEGELVESSEEDEGQVKEEDGDDVAIVKDQSPSKKRKGSLLRSDSPVVEVDVESVKIPHGKLRVITQHLPDNKLVFVRFASGFELRRSVYIARDHDREENFTLKNNKIRPGLNVFDEKGKELDWDYEHDTRFFEDLPVENEQQNDEAMDATASGSAANAATKEPEIGGIKIRSRGRGTKKFLQALKGSDDEE